MATIKAVSSKAPINTAIEYVTKEEKTEQKLQSGIGCNPETAYDEMQATKEMYNKTGGRQYKHYVQSFAPGETTPEQAQAIGRELAENNRAWQGFEVLVVTHKDREHIHNHFIVNSVSYEDGHKIQDGPKDLKNLKKQSDELCKREGLSVIDSSKPREAEQSTSYNKDTYKILKDAEQGKAQSYVQDTAIAIIEEKQTAQSREDFIQQMDSRGYKVEWTDKKKNITFTDKEREAHGEKKCKVRNSTLEKYYNIDFSKEGLENEFEENRARASRPEEPKPSLAGAVEQAKARALQQNSRIDGVQKELEEVRADRERASRASTGSSRSGTGRATGGDRVEGQREQGNSSTVRDIPGQVPDTESRDRELERTANHITEQPQNRSRIDAELERIRAEIEREQAQEDAERSRIDEVAGGQQKVIDGIRENSQEQRILKAGASRIDGEHEQVKGKQREHSGAIERLGERLDGLRERLARLREQITQTFNRIKGKGR